jgi:hypothetical protein
VGWVLFWAERNGNCKFNDNNNYNGKCQFNGICNGWPGGVEGAAG